MIIPIKCFTCGIVIGDKYRYYLDAVRKKKLERKKIDEKYDINQIYYLTNDNYEKTPEGEVLDDLGMKRLCCRRHFITHVDIE